MKWHLDKGSGNEGTQHEFVAKYMAYTISRFKWAQWMDDHIWPESREVGRVLIGTTAAFRAGPRLARDDVKLEAGDGDATLGTTRCRNG